jgi:hypothetical protein
VNCEFCSRQLEKLVFGYSRLRINKRFCNRQCAWKARLRAQTKPEKPRSCLYCGEMVPPQTLGRTRMYCNATCRKASARMGKGTCRDDMPAEMIDRLFNRAEAIRKWKQRVSSCPDRA